MTTQMIEGFLVVTAIGSAGLLGWFSKRALTAFVGSAISMAVASFWHMWKFGALETGGIVQAFCGGLWGLGFFYLFRWLKSKRGKSK